MRRIVLTLAAALLLVAATPLPPAPTQWLTDAANVIPADREAALNAKLEQHQRETGNHVLVYVARRVPAGTTLEELAAEAMRTWGVGDKEKDNGAILFLFIDDRQSRIEVGYGLEGTLTDARSKQILVNLRWSLQNGDYASAAELGASEIILAIAPPAPFANQEADRNAAVEARAAEIRAQDEKLFIPIVIFSIFFVAFILYTFYRVVVVGDWKLRGGTGFSSSSGSSSSSSGSSYSGGGGSGGGGGASDKW